MARPMTACPWLKDRIGLKTGSRKITLTEFDGIFNIINIIRKVKKIVYIGYPLYEKKKMIQWEKKDPKGIFFDILLNLNIGRKIMKYDPTAIFTLNGPQIRNAKKILNTDKEPCFIVLPKSLKDPVDVLDKYYILIGTITVEGAYRIWEFRYGWIPHIQIWFGLFLWWNSTN